MGEARNVAEQAVNEYSPRQFRLRDPPELLRHQRLYVRSLQSVAQHCGSPTAADSAV
jgi:hypothetical protein